MKSGESLRSAPIARRSCAFSAATNFRKVALTPSGGDVPAGAIVSSPTLATVARIIAKRALTCWPREPNRSPPPRSVRGARPATVSAACAGMVASAGGRRPRVSSLAVVTEHQKLAVHLRWESLPPAATVDDEIIEVVAQRNSVLPQPGEVVGDSRKLLRQRQRLDLCRNAGEPLAGRGQLLVQRLHPPPIELGDGLARDLIVNSSHATPMPYDANDSTNASDPHATRTSKRHCNGARQREVHQSSMSIQPVPAAVGVILLFFRSRTPVN